MYIPPLQSVSSSFGANLGSTPHLDLVPINWLQTVPAIDPELRVVNTAIALQSGRSWLRLKPMQESMNYKLEPKQERNGRFYAAEIAGLLNLETPDKSITLESLSLYRLLIQLPDLQGHVRLLGIAPNYASLRVGSRITDEASGKTYYNIEIDWEGEQMPPFYTI
jgi:hypothetical protein